MIVMGGFNAERVKMSNADAAADRGLAVRFENHTEDRLIGRRDMLIGLWAGAQLGLPEGSRTIYALQVMAAGLMDPRPNDVVDKIMHDFSTRGIPITRGQILVQLSRAGESAEPSARRDHHAGRSLAGTPRLSGSRTAAGQKQAGGLTGLPMPVILSWLTD